MKSTYLAVGVVVVALAVNLPVNESAAQPRGVDRSPQRSYHVPSRRSASLPRIGARVRSVPSPYRTISVGPRSYRYYDGFFYSPFSAGGWVVVGAPIGARVRSIPFGYVGFSIGASRYYYGDYAYYLYEPRSREYVVVAEPDGAETAVVSASESGAGEIFVYPNLGQSDELRDRDRYECYLWAVEQTSFDPSTQSAGATGAGDYNRALSACLEGRGYTVK